MRALQGTFSATGGDYPLICPITVQPDLATRCGLVPNNLQEQKETE